MKFALLKKQYFFSSVSVWFTILLMGSVFNSISTPPPVSVAMLMCMADAGDISLQEPVDLPQNDPGLALNVVATPNSVVPGGIFTGEVDVTDPVFNRPLNFNCNPSGTATAVHYEVFPFQVDIADTYTFVMCAPVLDGYGVIYQNAFDASNTPGNCPNYVNSDNDAGVGACGDDPILIGALVPNVTYFLVTTSNFNGGVGTYDWTVTSSGGAGQIFGGADPGTYDYTFVVVDDNGFIIAYETGPDFSAYMWGDYSVYGLSYDQNDVALLPVADGSVTFASLSADLSSGAPSFCGELTATGFDVEIQPLCMDSDTLIDTTLIQGSNFTVGPSSYSVAGNYTDTIVTAQGCDSVVNLVLDFCNNGAMSSIDTTIAAPGTITINGTVYNTSGFYPIVIPTGGGVCDSIVNFTLEICTDDITNIDTTLVTGETITVNGNVYNATGTYVDTITFTDYPCDSIVNLDLDYCSHIENNIDTVLLPGQTVTVGVNVYSVAGMYSDTFDIAGSPCDSIVNLDMNFCQNFDVDIDTVLFTGQSITVLGVTYNTAGTFNEVRPIPGTACDTTVNVILDFCDDVLTTIDTILLPGETIMVGANVYIADGMYSDTFPFIGTPCDSVVNLTLNYCSHDTYLIDTTIIIGQTITVGSSVYGTTGMFVDTLIKADGCDSIINLDLEVITCAAEPSDLANIGMQEYPVNSPDLAFEWLPTFFNGSSTLTVVLDAGDPTWNRPQNNSCSPSGVGTSVYYEVFPFTVNAPGLYNFEMCSPDLDGFGAIYINDFDPTAHCTNFIAADNDDGLGACDNDALMPVINLVNGVTYFLITTTSGNNDVGTATWNITGPGDIIGGPSPDEYDYTYVIVNANDSIVGMDQGPDMTMMEPGIYQVCGISYLISDSSSLPVTDGSLSYSALTADLGGATASFCGVLSNSCVTVDIAPCENSDTTVIIEFCVSGTYDGTLYTVNPFGGENVYPAIQDTFLTALGCDSVVSTVIIVGPQSQPGFTAPVYLCPGDTFDGIAYFADDVVLFNLPGEAQYGCDSSYSTQVFVLPIDQTVLNPFVCSGESFNGIIYPNDVTFIDTLSGSDGCDSIVTTNLDVRFPTDSTVFDTVCQGDLLFGFVINADTTFIDTVAGSNTCDSVVTTEVHVLLPTAFSYFTSVCEGSPFNGIVYTEDTAVVSVLVGSNGCDSVVTANLAVLETPRDTLPIAICEGDSYNGTAYFADITLYDTLVAANACDSFIVTIIDVLQHAVPTVIDTNVCIGDPFAGIVYQVDTTLIDTLVADNGCDSVVTTNISILDISFDTIPLVLCEGDIYLGDAYFNDTVVTDTFVNAVGCDSFLTAEISVIPTSDSTLDLTLCEGDIYQGVIYVSDSTFFDTLTAANGCDSFLVTNITVNFPTDTAFQLTLCSGDFYNGTAYFADDTVVHVVTGSNGCDSTITADITVNPVPTPVITGDSAFCFGDFGLITTTGTYASYLWSNGDVTQSTMATDSGQYSVTVTDINGCTGVDDINILEFPQVAINALTITNSTSPTANDGEIEINTGVGYVFLWDDGQTIPFVGGLSVGQHCVTVTNVIAGCVADTCFTITSPPAMQASSIGDTLLCAGDNSGEISFTINGGMPGYTYQWLELPGGGLNGTGTIVNSGDTETISGLIAGDYSITITDTFGIETTTIATVGEPLPLQIQVDNLGSTPVSCFGGTDGSATVTPNGGTPPYNFTWSAGNVNTTSGTSSTASDLPFGPVSVEISDDNGCSLGQLTIVVTQPTDSLTLMTDSTRVSCFQGSDGSASVIPMGGTSGYTYQWQDGQTTQTAVGLLAGNYSVTVTDLRGCSETVTATVTEPDILGVITDSKMVSCFGFSDGSISFDATFGGTPPYVYSIDDGERFVLDTFAVGLEAGNYDLIVMDVNGCTWEKPINVGTPSELSVDLGPDVEIELGDSVSLEAFTNFDFTIDSISWTPTTWLDLDSVTQGLSAVSLPLETISYSLTVTDTAGCSDTDEILISVDKLRNLFIPNIFTPNADGRNDFFAPVCGQGVKQLLLFQVFDRWGALVYEKRDFAPNDAGSRWDGVHRDKMMDVGVYTYYIEAEYIDGSIIPASGDVTLVR